MDTPHAPGPATGALRHLWRRKWWIAALALVAAAIAGVVAQSRAASPAYIASAQLLIKGALPVEDLIGISTQDRRPEQPPLSPVTYRNLLLGQALLQTVAERSSVPLAALRQSVTVDVELESDTSYRRVYSPLITLSVRERNDTVALAILEAWLEEFLRHHGAMLAEFEQQRIDRVREAYIQALSRLGAIQRGQPAQTQPHNALPVDLQERAAEAEVLALEEELTRRLQAGTPEGTDLELVAGPVVESATQADGILRKALLAGVAAAVFATLIFLLEALLSKLE